MHDHPGGERPVWCHLHICSRLRDEDCLLRSTLRLRIDLKLQVAKRTMSGSMGASRQQSFIMRTSRKGSIQYCREYCAYSIQALRKLSRAARALMSNHGVVADHPPSLTFPKCLFIKFTPGFPGRVFCFGLSLCGNLPDLAILPRAFLWDRSTSIRSGKNSPMAGSFSYVVNHK